MATTVQKVVQRLETGTLTKSEQMRAPSVLERIVEIGHSQPEVLSEQHSIDHLISLIGAVSCQNLCPGFLVCCFRVKTPRVPL